MPGTPISPEVVSGLSEQGVLGTIILMMVPVIVALFWLLVSAWQARVSDLVGVIQKNIENRAADAQIMREQAHALSKLTESVDLMEAAIATIRIREEHARALGRDR